MNTETQVAGHEWSEEALFCKAMLYFQQMDSHESTDWKYGFWSALGLEFLARAALAHISPVLLAYADSKNWKYLAHALGIPPTETNFFPISVSIKDVFQRLHKLVPDFSKEIHEFCKNHMGIRNSEIHSGNLAFESLVKSRWLPRYYSACKVLTESIGSDLEDLILDSTAANDLIRSLEKEIKEEVTRAIEDYESKWSGKTEAEKTEARRLATLWARRDSGHRKKCPSCNSLALLKGTPTGSVSTIVDDDEIVQKQKQMPSSFVCIACGLRISGLSRLSACGLGDAFTDTTHHTPEEYFDLYTGEDLYTREDLEQIARELEFEHDYNE
ncbi:MAG: hypothetical protein F4Y90_10120 [Rhodothermaceae bacterium]|nr:hypothetical protein [Rhodothermaceae bacterium]